MAIIACVSGYFLGHENAPSMAQAETTRADAYKASFNNALATGRSASLENGFEEGIRSGRRQGADAGAEAGKVEGTNAAETIVAQLDQESDEAAAAASSTWCDQDGYCLQRSPGSGGPSCPPGTVENAGGVVCVPIP